MLESAPFLLCASPRQGNSLTAARFFAEGVNASMSPGRQRMAILARLGEHKILPCTGCGVCSNMDRDCPIAGLDDSAVIFKHFLHAPFIAVFAPVYFYHLPAQLKALLDRCQNFYSRMEAGHSSYDRLRERKAYCVLTAAREQGEQLFSGSLLTLKYALRPFKLKLTEPILLKGLDGPSDLAGRPELSETIIRLGQEAAGHLC